MKLSEIQLDFLKENFNIGVGRGAKVLNTLLSFHITLSVPEIRLIDELSARDFHHYSSSIATVNLQFNGNLNGSCKLLFPADSALKLVRQVSGEPEMADDSDFDSMSVGVLKEIGNVVLNSVIGVLSNSLGIQLHYTVPTFEECLVDDLIKTSFDDEDDVGIIARIGFSIKSMDVRGEVLTIFKMGSFSQMLNQIDKKLNV